MSAPTTTPRDTAGDVRRAGRWLLDHPVVIASAIAVALFGVGELISPGFAAWGQIINVLRVAAFLGVIAIGQTIVVLSGNEHIDLSVGKVATFGAIVAAGQVQAQNDQVLQGLVVALLACALVGLVNGLGVTLLRIPALVMTLAMVAVLQGVILLLTRGQPTGRAAPIMSDLVNARWLLGIPGILWLWLALALGVIWFLRRTTFGWRVYALGSNRGAAYLSGVQTRRTTILVFVLSSTFAGLGGFLLLGFTETVFLNLADGQMLPSVAAVVIGGTTLAGGVGGYAGTAVGAIVLTVLQSILTTVQLDASGRQIVNGLVLLALLAMYGRQRRLRQ